MGWSKGQPNVLVTGPVIERLGMPYVNYDSLHQFLTDDLGIPYDQKTDIKLFGRSGNSPLGGFHVPYTRTIHVNAPLAEKEYVYSGGTMRILAHEARHLSDSTNRRALTAVEVLARWASYKAGYEFVAAMPYISGLAIYGGFKARSIYYKHEPAEKRARAEEVKPSTVDHSNDILFPDSIRLENEMYRRQLDTETLKQLGVHHLDFIYASDYTPDQIDF